MIVLVAKVDEIHEVLRRTVAAGRGKVADGLIAPTGRQRMLADRKQFQVRIAHLLGIVDQLMRQLAIAQPARGVVAGPLPTAQVDLVERQRLVQPIGLRAAFQPRAIVPLVPVHVDHFRRRARRHLGAETERIGLLGHVVVVADLELVERSLAQPRHEQFPETAGDVLAHGVATAVPGVEIAHHAHAGGVRRPHREIDPVHAVDRSQLGPQTFVAAPVRPLVQEVQIVVGQQVGE